MKYVIYNHITSNIMDFTYNHKNHKTIISISTYISKNAVNNHKIKYSSWSWRTSFNMTTFHPALDMPLSCISQHGIQPWAEAIHMRGTLKPKGMVRLSQHRKHYHTKKLYLNHKKTFFNEKKVFLTRNVTSHTME